MPDYATTVKDTIRKAIEPGLEELAEIRKSREVLEKRGAKYADLKEEIRGLIESLQAAIVNGADDSKLDEVTALKLKLQSIDDIEAGIKTGLTDLETRHAAVLENIGNKTNWAYNALKQEFQKIVTKEAEAFVKQLESKHAALASHISPSSFIPELNGVRLGNLTTHRHLTHMFRLPSALENWI